MVIVAAAVILGILVAVFLLLRRRKARTLSLSRGPEPFPAWEGGPNHTRNESVVSPSEAWTSGSGSTLAVAHRLEKAGSNHTRNESVASPSEAGTSGSGSALVVAHRLEMAESELEALRAEVRGLRAEHEPPPSYFPV